MGGQQPPMDDASFSQDPSMMGDPSAMGGDPMGGDPNAMGSDQMGGDPNAMGPDPMADQNATGPDQMADPNAMDSSDDTTSIINQLSDEDKEAVRSYAKSMLEKGESGQQDADGEQPMMEQVIFTKKQLNKIQENFGPSQDELMKKNDRKELPKKNSKSKNSPFNSPFA